VNQPSVIADADALELNCGNQKVEDPNQQLWKVRSSKNVVDSLQDEVVVTMKKPETSRVAQDNLITDMDFNTRLNHFANKRKERVSIVKDSDEDAG
jgi:hypothetical protein